VLQPGLRLENDHDSTVSAGERGGIILEEFIVDSFEYYGGKIVLFYFQI
jgi:hypothetical protein